MIPIKAIVTGLASATLLGSLLVETYIRVPQKVLFGSTPTPLPEFGEDAVFLLFPGFGGPDANTARVEAEVRRSDLHFQADRFVLCYDWSAWCGNLLRAAFDGQRVGRALGRQLGQDLGLPTLPTLPQLPDLDLPHRPELSDRPDGRLPELPEGPGARGQGQGQGQGQGGRVRVRDLHVVGISVGAFAADACIREYKRTVLERHGPGALRQVRTRLTLLDPFTSRGLVGTRYGAKNFGLEADYCEHYLNTDDPVPSTNLPLPHAYTFDVTGAQERRSFVPLPGDSMHSWPVAYFGLNWAQKIDPRRRMGEFPSDHAVNARGGVRNVE